MKTDPAVVRAAISGNPQAFSTLLQAHTALVYGIALATAGRLGVAEEAAQEVFLHAWRNISTLREPEHFTAWLRQLARNRCIQLARREDRRRRTVVADTDAVERQGDPRDPLQAIEDEAALAEALEALEPHDREVLVLYYLEEQSTREVAEALGLGEPAVRKRISRARGRLRDGLDARMAFLPLLLPGAAFHERVLARLELPGRSLLPRHLAMGAGGVLAAGAALWLALAPSPKTVRAIDPLLLGESEVDAQAEVAPEELPDTARRQRARERLDARRQALRERHEEGLPSFEADLTKLVLATLPEDLDPLSSSAPSHQRVVSLVHDPLFFQDADGSWQSELVDTHTVRGTVLTLTLAPQQWHDDTEVSGADVCATVARIQRLQTPRAEAWAAGLVDCSHRGRTATLTVQGDADPRALASFALQPAHALGRGIGTGPFRAQQGRRSVRLTAVDDRAPIRELDWRAAGDPYVAMRTVDNGGALGVLDVPPSIASLVEERPDVTLRARPDITRATLSLSETGALAEPVFREAIDAALDRDELCRLVQPLPCEPLAGTSRSVPDVLSPVTEQVAGRWGAPGLLSLTTTTELGKYWLVPLGNQLVRNGLTVETTRRVPPRDAGGFDAVLTEDGEGLALAKLGELDAWHPDAIALATWLEQRWKRGR